MSVVALAGLGVAQLASAAPDPTEQSEAGAPAHKHGARGDLVRAALRLDSLTTSQRQQIEQLVASEKTTHQNVRLARGQLMQALANGVSAGSVTDATVAPQVQALEAAIQADEPGDRAALERLHAILTPAQRAELVGRIESRVSQMKARFQEWKQRATGGGDAGPVGRMGPLGRALGLSDAQRAQIKANLAGSKPADADSLRTDAKAERQRVLDAFKGDRFVMNEIAPPRDPRLLDERAEGMVRLAKAAVPVLTAEQRATAAAKLREFAARQAQAK